MTDLELKKYAAIQCPHCGHIQGRTTRGSVFSYKGKFKSVQCYNCRKRIEISELTILFSSDSAQEVSAWVKGYKTRRGEEE